MKCFKGSRDYMMKRKKFLHHKSDNKKFWKKFSVRRIRHMKNFEDAFHSLSYRKLDHVSYLFIIGW